MPRAPFNILVLPYRLDADGVHRFAVFHRSTVEMWQFIAGGGEDDEAPLVAAMREANEEARIVVGDRAWRRLDAVASIPRTAFPGAHWPETVYVVPEYSFAV
ncbi:MAG: NUDIX domain-containing protein, partial [Planctomycetaceae bacterium]|nr:NUDIX domain-containing protein [Planctomycetaceae bacterium]